MGSDWSSLSLFFVIEIISLTSSPYQFLKLTKMEGHVCKTMLYFIAYS